MSKTSLLALATIAGLSAIGPAIAGHEWTDGAMGPPFGRSYDTTMPIFPREKRTAPKTIEEPSQVCERAISNSTTSPSGVVDKRELPQMEQRNETATSVRQGEICRSQVQ